MITDQTLHFLIVGSLLGFSSGISPGPLLTLVLTQTIKHNKTEGIKVAISPLITDLPIILLSVLVFSTLSHFSVILASISFIGAIFLAYLGIESIKTKELNIEIEDSKSESIMMGIITNLMSPNPYLFWATVGTPYIFKALEINVLTVTIFFLSFYFFLIGSKIGIAIIVGRAKVFINQKLYVAIMKILGLALLIFSIIFFYDGIKYLDLF